MDELLAEWNSQPLQVRMEMPFLLFAAIRNSFPHLMKNEPLQDLITFYEENPFTAEEANFFATERQTSVIWRKGRLDLLLNSSRASTQLTLEERVKEYWSRYLEQEEAD